MSNPEVMNDLLMDEDEQEDDEAPKKKPKKAKAKAKATAKGKAKAAPQPPSLIAAPTTWEYSPVPECESWHVWQCKGYHTKENWESMPFQWQTPLSREIWTHVCQMEDQADLKASCESLETQWHTKVDVLSVVQELF